jgi:type II secretory pathway component GspD/PulD (secretin)
MRTSIAHVVLVLALSIGPRCLGQDLPAGAEFRSPSEVATHLVRVLRTTNKAQTNRYVPRVYDLDNVNPYDVIRFIRRSVEIEEGAWFLYGEPTDPDHPHESVKSGKAVVIVPQYQVPYIDQLMEVIDTTGLTSSSGDELYYYRPLHRTVSDPDFVSLVRAVLSPNHSGGDQFPDTPVNAMVFYDSPSSIDDLRRWLPVLDQPLPQVMVEARIYEINVENDNALGLDYVSWKNGPGRNLFAVGSYYEKASISDLDGPGTPFGQPYVGDFSASGHYYSYFCNMSSAFFDFLVSKQKARVLTAAKVLTRHGVAAELEVSDVIFFWRTNECIDPDVGFPLPEGTTIVDADWKRLVLGDDTPRELGAKSAGVFLEIEPTIGTEGIVLDVDLDVVSHTGFDSSGYPQLVRRTYDSSVRIQDGQELVLGGYDRDMVVQQTNKVPILGSLPVLGWFFGGEKNLVKQRKVVVVVSAQIVPDFSAMSGKDSIIDAALIRARASGEWPVENLRTEAGFDQWLLDPER